MDKIFSFLSVNGNYELIGSSNKKYNIKYPSDYDLQEHISLQTLNDYQKVLKKFQRKMVQIKKKTEKGTMFLTDFKSGMFQSQPIRWTADDILAGKKKIDDKEIKLIDTFNHNNGSLTKMDLVVKHRNVYIEFSCNYYFNQQGNSSKEMIKARLLYDVKKYFIEKNFMKALKRLFSVIVLENDGDVNEEAKQFIQLFNSTAGKQYQEKSRLKTKLLLIEKGYVKEDEKPIKQAIDKLNQSINRKIEKFINN